MSVDIYAGVETHDEEHGALMGPVIHFKHWEPEMLADDADERAERDESAFIPNPDFIENAAMNLSNDNAETLLALLGFETCPEGFGKFPIEDVHKAAFKGLNGASARYSEPASTFTSEKGATFHSGGIAEGYIEAKLQKLLAMIVAGKPLGATHIMVG